jgi:two-component system chemotaxis sensor kinase CheA
VADLKQRPWQISPGMSNYFEDIDRIVRPLKNSIGKIMVENDPVNEKEVSQMVNEQRLGADSEKFGEMVMNKDFFREKDFEKCLKEQTGPKEIEPGKKAGAVQDSILKVKAARINYMADMIGELLIAEGQINDNSYIFNQIRKITKNIQYAAMELRTEKVRNLFINCKRVVRDLVKKLDKPLNVELKGEELEIDRDLIEHLEEPMMHLIRNAVSHGIEGVHERKSASKPEEGKITLEAERRGNNIIISIMDDGAGLNLEKIVRKAVEKNIVKQEAVPNMTETEIHNLIFVPGFSTADKVDLVSGRGIGMDIVTSVVSSLRGKIEIHTEPGRFTKFSLVFPLNTAVIDGMVVRIESNMLVIPISSIIGMVKLKNEEIHRIDDQTNVVKLRGEVIPVIDIKKYYDMGETDLRNTAGVIVENSDRKMFLLTVDEIVTKKEIVIKSIGRKFEKLKGISSGTVLAGGKIGLVLDVDQITENSQVKG